MPSFINEPDIIAICVLALWNIILTMRLWVMQDEINRLNDDVWLCRRMEDSHWENIKFIYKRIAELVDNQWHNKLKRWIRRK